MKYLPFVAIITLLVLLLAWRVAMAIHAQVYFRDGQVVSIKARLLAEPEVSGKTQRFFLKKSGYETVFVTTSIFPEYHYADRLIITGSIRKKTLANTREITTLVYPQIQKQPSGFSLVTSIKRSIAHLFQASLPPTSASLLLGIVFGSKEAMPQAFLDQLRLEGLTHVIAASGMNVTMVAAALLFLTTQFLSRKVAILSAMFGILLYCLLTGFEPSITRASLMSLVGCTALLIGKQQFGLLSLALTAYTMMFLQPVVIFDLGFQLSFLSTIGIMYLKPLLDGVLISVEKVKPLHFISEDLTTTVAAQLLALPLLLSTFGSYNLLSVFVNLLVLWTIPILMILGGIGALVGLVFPMLGKLVLFLALPLLLYFQQVVELASAYSVNLTITQTPWLLFAGYYGVLLALCLLRRHEKTAVT